MTTTTDRSPAGRTLLSCSSRLERRAEDDDDLASRVRHALQPGKRTSSDPPEPRPLADATSPGKLKLSDVGRDLMPPASALSYATTIQRIDRRAEPGAAEIDDHGALASAFSFLEDTRAGTPLPAELAARLSIELGVDLANVRVHTDARAAKAAGALGARAFTIGQDIYFAAGAYDPQSAGGIELIAHEVAHTVDNARGGAATGGRRLSRPGDAHEQRADDFARGFVSRQNSFSTSDPAVLVEQVRRQGRRMNIPELAEFEQHLGGSLGFVEAYTGEAAQLACRLMGAGAFAVRNIVAFADPSPQRETLLHELTHIVQMGGRAATAPDQFRIGSLRIGSRDAAEEHEARSVATGDVSQVAVSADPDVIHREDPPATTTPTTKPWEPNAAKDRFRAFSASLEKAADGKPVFGPVDDDEYRYAVSSKKHFERSDYAAKAFVGVTDLSKTAMDDELSKLWKDYGKELGLCKLGTSSKFVWVDPTDPKWNSSVEYLPDRTAKKASVTDKWKDYLAILEKINKKHPIKPAPVVFKKNAKCDFDRTVDFTTDGAKPFTDTELGKCRDNFEDAFVACQDFHWNGGGKKHWETWFADVIKPEGGALFAGGYAQMQGTIFGRIATEDINKALGGAVQRAEHFFADDGFKKNVTKTLAADAITVIGTKVKYPAVIDFKSGAERPDTDMMNAAHDYNLIIGPPGVPRYKVDTVEQTQHFEQVLYVFSTVEVAKTWATKLKKMIPGAGVLQIVPDVNDKDIGTVDMSTVNLTMNPTFQVSFSGKNAATHHLSAPPIAHPGVTFKDVTINTKPGSADVTGGSVVLDVDMGGAMKAQGIRKPLTPEAGGARIENKLPGLQGDLSKILKGAEVEAKVTDDGVEGSLTVKSGAKIGVVDITGGSVKIKYGKDGGLAVTGDVDLSYNAGKVKGKITVGWQSGAWTFDGKVEFPAGMVDGLSAFTANLSYGAGKWKLGVDQLGYTRTFKAITLSGKALGVKFDLDTGKFSGILQLEADLGMFGTASGRAEIKDSKLTKAEISYDSPELKYPAKSGTPTLKGTVGGTLTYDNDKFSGSIRGTANLNVPALQKIAGEGGLGLGVDAHIKEDGSYSGTIKTTSPLKFGKYFEVPSLSCTIAEDGAVTGDFAIKIKGIKYLESAEIGCKIDKDGFHVVKADVHAAFGKPSDKMWGTLDVGYDDVAGLKITGTLNVKIKEGMVAKGTLTYNSEKNTIDVALTVDEITLFDFSKTQNLFKFSKQIPLVSFYSIIGIYLDLGLDLDFQFNMKLGLKPTISLDGLSFETWEYNKISAEIELLGQLRAALIATPKVGLGLFAISPELLRGGGGIKVPITGEALLKPTGKLKVGYTPSGGVDGDASIGMQLTFGIKGAVKPYAEAAVLGGAWNPQWTGDSLADFEILPPKELFNFTLDLAGDMSKKEPAIPTSPQAPTAPSAAKQMPQEAPKTTEAGGGGPGKDAVPPTSGPSGGAADDSVFKMASLTGALKGLPGYATISGFMEKAGKVWEKIKGFFGRVAKAFKSFFESIGNAIEEVINGFAAEGLGYLPKLIKKIVGDTTWDIIEPIVNAAAGTAEAILQLFETDPPKSVGEFFIWGLKLMQKAFGVAFNSIPALISAINTMMSRLAGLAVKIVNKMVQDGMIGVKRHQYYYWAFGNHYFLAADEYKINVLGTSIQFRETGMLLNPNDLVGAGLFEAFERMGVRPTNMAVDDKTGDTYRDRWV